ncbi:hypothetical protein LINPERHAP1_LOCUS12767 [Linum perenne]
MKMVGAEARTPLQLFKCTKGGRRTLKKERMPHTLSRISHLKLACCRK